jgi:hypothetical protein
MGRWMDRQTDRQSVRTVGMQICSPERRRESDGVSDD